ncbi:hypothetical protein B7463_g6237, partial [Scytalidium lignicola]
MARVTRSRKIEIVEDTTALETGIAPLPKSSSALVDITANPGMNAIPTLEEEEVATELKGLKKAYRSIIGGGRGKKTKKAKKEKQESVTSVEAQDGILDKQDKITSANGLANGNTEQVVEADTENTNPVKEQTLPQRTLRPRNNKEMASTDVESSKAESNSAVVIPVVNENEKYSREEGNDKDTEILPVKPISITLDEVEKAYRGEDATAPTPVADEHGTDDDSFVEQIMSRSPAKPVSRIEDSVEALDQLEEVLEALDQVAMAERTLSSVEVSKRLSPRPPTDLKSAKSATHNQLGGSSQATTKEAKKTSTPRAGYGSVRVKSTAPKQNTVLKRSKSVMLKGSDTNNNSREMSTPEEETPVQATKRPAAKRPASLLPPKPPVKSTKPVTVPTFELPGEVVARRLKEQREARLAQRAASEQIPLKPVVSTPKIKSTKPPTRPSFELPGEAISRRKKEALEIRLKAQEEEDRKRREFKAKPVPSATPSHVPRETVASRARQSKIGVENTENDNSATSKRPSTTGTHRLSVANLNQANVSVPRGSGPVHTLSRKTSSIASGSRTLSPTEVQIQRQRAREIYNRDAKYTEDHERERREREAIAKRSREEAAERGRQASREWAERQKAKKLLEAGKGQVAGHGSGGQVGSNPAWKVSSRIRARRSGVFEFLNSSFCIGLGLMMEELRGIVKEVMSSLFINGSDLKSIMNTQLSGY